MNALEQTTTYTYDHLNRLTTSIATGQKTHNLDFSYDRFGNMRCVTDGETDGPCPNWTFNEGTNRIGTSGFTYDAAGNLTGDGTHTYQCDAEGRLKSVDDGNTASYVYNASGQRVEKNVGGSYTKVVYGAAGQVIGYHNRTDWTQQLVPFGATPLAKYQDNKAYFLHGNHLGSTTFLTDHSGGATQGLLFYPWGQQWESAGTVKEERFASLGQRDSESSLDPTLFRMYESRLYRWLSPDPAAGDIFNPQSLNRYAYVLNNPANLIDPLGLDVYPDGSPCDPFSEFGCPPPCDPFTDITCPVRTPPHGPIPPYPPFPPGGDGGAPSPPPQPSAAPAARRGKRPSARALTQSSTFGRHKGSRSGIQFHRLELIYFVPAYLYNARFCPARPKDCGTPQGTPFV